MKKSLILTFWALAGISIVVISEFFIPAVRELFKGSLLFLLPIAAFSLLGAVLIFLSLKQKIEKKLKKYLLLTGISSMGLFISVLLHNVIYGIFIHLFGADFWNIIGFQDEPFFFIIAILICPIGYLIGVTGSIVLFFKKSDV